MTKFSVVPKGLSTLLSRLLVMKAGGLDALRCGAWPAIHQTESGVLFQHHDLKTSILWHSAFYMVQFSHLYMTMGKTIALAIHTFVSKVMSLLLICCLGLS